MDDGIKSNSWRAERRFGRLRLAIHVLRHHYYDGSHRWVCKPSIVLDVRESLRSRLRSRGAQSR